MLFILVEEEEMFDDDTFNGLGKRVFAGYWLLTGYFLEFTAIETIYKVTKNCFSFCPGCSKQKRL